MATLEELVVKVRADSTQFNSELAKMTTTTKQAAGKMESSFSAAGMAARFIAPAAVVSTIVGLGKAGVDAAGKFTDLSQQIDFAAASIASLEAPLVKSGSSIEGLSASIGIMSANIGQALSGNEQLNDMFTRLGLSASELEKMGSEKAFYAIADALSKVGSSAEQAEIGRALLGRGFAKLKPLLAEAGGNLEDFVDKQKELGNALDEQQIKRLDDFGDAIAGLGLDARNAAAGGLADMLRILDQLSIRYSKTISIIGSAASIAAKSSPYGALYRLTSPGKIADSIEAANASDYAKKAAATSNNGKKFTTTISGGDGVSLEKEYEEQQKKLEKSTTRVTAYNKAVKETKDKQDEAKDSAKELADAIKDRLGSAFEAAIFDAKNAGDAISGILNGIARQIARTTIIDPLSEGIGSYIKDSGIGKSISSFLFPSRATGEFNVQNDMIAKVHKGEMIIPAPQASAMRQGGSGQQVVIHQNLTFNDAVRGAARQEIMQAAPYIASQAHDAVFASIQRGGSAAKIVGKR